MVARSKKAKNSAATRPQKSVASSGRADSATLLSTRHFTSEHNKLALDPLGVALRKARRIFLAAAYYDVAFCKTLLAHAPSAAEVRLLFNGLGGARLLEQRRELTNLERNLGKRTEVRLAFEQGIFHTKLFLIQNASSQVAFVGSANATMPAMTVNEEILLKVPGGGAISEYADRVWLCAKRLTDLDGRLRAKGLISFFRTGSLYFKPTTALQLTLNPFTGLLAALSDADQRKLAAVRLPHSDPEPGVGAFNLQRAAHPTTGQGAAVGFNDDPGEVKQGAEELKHRKASIKPFSVETCLGYWVPRALDGDWQETLEKTSGSKRRRLVQLRDLLEEVGEEALQERYAEYVDAVKRLLDQNAIAYDQHLVDGRHDPFDVGQFGAFYTRVMSRLKSDEYVKRSCTPFVSGAMPEIWDDPLAFDEFKSSFFDYLEYVGRSPGNRSYVPGRILARIGVDMLQGADAPSIASALEKYLKTAGWGEEDWK